MSDPFAITNTFLTDENVDGPVITIAREMEVISILRDVDLEVPCNIQDYDQCLTEFAVANGYVIVTANVRDFRPKYEALSTHPGIIYITAHHRHNHLEIAKRLRALQHEDLMNQVIWI